MTIRVYGKKVAITFKTTSHFVAQSHLKRLIRSVKDTLQVIPKLHGLCEEIHTHTMTEMEHRVLCRPSPLCSLWNQRPMSHSCRTFFCWIPHPPTYQYWEGRYHFQNENKTFDKSFNKIRHLFQ